MSYENEQYEPQNAYNDIGIVFIGPIVGLPASLISTFDTFKKRGIDVETVDIWEGQNIKKNLWNILRLTIFPGNHKRLVQFANNYNEHKLFEIILNKIDKLKTQGSEKIILGGMSGGFIFASRIVQISLDGDLVPHAQKIQHFIKGLFGISPLVFYPPDVLQRSADLKFIPSHIPTILIWGDADTIIPKETITHSQEISKNHNNIKSFVIRGSDVGRKDRSIRHQFFGGRDFIRPLKNIFWNPKAETLAIDYIYDLIKSINPKNNDK